MKSLFKNTFIQYLLIINGLLFLVYIIEMTNLSTQGYEIQAEHQRLAGIREEYTQTRIQVIEMRSLKYIEEQHNLRDMDSDSYQIFQVKER